MVESIMRAQAIEVLGLAERMVSTTEDSVLFVLVLLLMIRVAF
jgi:hypothetical protein